ncbi:carbohydrate ABC transporter permease [Microbacterium sp. A204]|uniref:carbohydrate ABC transporter permease n=1 Tax=Microbacterium sp. A204 TaxID=3457321 RepID=UPI003FD4FF5A
MVSPSTERRGRRVTATRRSRRLGWLVPLALLAPVIVLVGALRVVPMLLALGLSFTDMDLRKIDGVINFVGLQQYANVLSSGDFGTSVLVTITIVVPSLVLEMGLGLLIAMWLNKPTRTRRATRAMMLVPYLLVPVVIGNFFRMFFSAQFGQLNYLLALVGMDPQAWLTDPATVQWAVVAMEVWHTTPFVILMCLAGLTGIPQEALEAAMVDGANAWQRFRYVVLPNLLPILGAVFVLRGMDALQLFDEVYVLTGGGPGRLTSVINMYLYQFGFRQFRLGETSAAVTIIVITLAVLGLLVLALRKQRNAWKVVSS